MNELFFYQKIASSPHLSVRLRRKNRKYFTNGSKLGAFNQNLIVYTSYIHSQPFREAMQQESENLEFVQGVFFEFTSSFKNNGTKYLLIFDFPVDIFAIQKRFLMLLLLEDIID